MKRLFLLCCAGVLLMMLLMLTIVTFHEDHKIKISLTEEDLNDELLLLPHEEDFDHEKSIFFIESFRKDSIPGRFLCSIESAARIHRNTFIDVMMTSQILRKSGSIKSLLKAYSNVRFFHLNATSLSSKTSLKDWLLQEKWKFTKYPEINFGDVLRYIFLYKYGGIYLDMDVIVLKNLTKQENFAGLESDIKVNNAVMGFRKGHPFLNECLVEITKSVDGKLWGIYGPLLMTKIFKRRCHAKIPDTTLKNCSDIKLYKKDVLYPVAWKKLNKLFEENKEFTETLLNHPDFLTLHFWNSKTEKFKISLEGQSLLSVVARNMCPIITFMSDQKFYCKFYCKDS